MNKDKFLGALRELLVAAGAMLFVFLPSAEGYWNEATGIALAVLSLGFAIKSKDATSDMVVTTLRKVITFVGIVFAAKIPADLLAAISTIVATLIPLVWSILGKKK